VSTSAEAIRPGFAWNATRVASVLMVVIIAVIALIFWPAFETSDAQPPVTQQAHGLAAAHEHIVVDGEACPQCLP
jgi:type VI protein secretion system component VasK